MFWVVMLYYSCCDKSSQCVASVFSHGVKAKLEEAECRRGEGHLGRSNSKASLMGHFNEMGESIVSMKKEQGNTQKEQSDSKVLSQV